jgi:membrane protease YdiL (CAAX protease family)
VKLDVRVPAVLILAALVLVFEEYVGDRDFFAAHFSSYAHHPDFELWSYWWWAGGRVVGYALVPIFFIVATRSTKDALLGTGSLRTSWAIYGALFVAVFPILYFASASPSFQQTYPFYRQATRSFRDLIGWELAYGASFVALEIFFRGFLIGLLRRTLGFYAVFIAMLPYTMVHFGKPPLETLGAIVAGVVLGSLAITTRSIWGAAILHIAIAWTMDGLALLRA